MPSFHVFVNEPTSAFYSKKRGIATTSIVSIFITLYIGVFNPIALFMYRLEKQKVHGKTVNGNINEVATSISRFI